MDLDARPYRLDVTNHRTVYYAFRLFSEHDYIFLFKIISFSIQLHVKSQLIMVPGRNKLLCRLIRP